MKAENSSLLKEIGAGHPALGGTRRSIFERIKNEQHRPLLTLPTLKAEIDKIADDRRDRITESRPTYVDTSKLVPTGGKGNNRHG